MLLINVASRELYDSARGEFYYTPSGTLSLEHSLLSISKWEAKWHIAILDEKIKLTQEQFLDYVKCMTIGKVPDEIYNNLSEENLKEISDYMADPHTATVIHDDSKGKKSGTFLTSERIYAWMAELQIPFETEKWHINRLLTLIHVVSIDQSPKKKKKKSDVAADYRRLNEQRLAANGGRG